MSGMFDRANRKIEYLRISITDRCNPRCVYCMPPEGVEHLPHERVMRNEEFMRIIGLFASLGVVKVRFTGGEPFLYPEFLIALTRRAAIATVGAENVPGGDQRQALPFVALQAFWEKEMHERETPA